MSRLLAVNFTSASQQARVCTEAWAQANLYCVKCESAQLRSTPPNTQAVDFTCDGCESVFQLKSQSFPFGNRVTDSGYDAMCRAIESNRIPNLILVHYDRAEWSVKNAMLIPSFGFSLAAVEKRKPLSPTARRAGWVGCNILLSSIPSDLRVPLIADSQPIDAIAVRRQYRSMAVLQTLDVSTRGWLIDVLNIARSLNKSEFSLGDMYSQDHYLSALHPRNKNVRPKIRQQLQALRDLGMLRFVGSGNYQWNTNIVDKLPIP